MGSRSLSLGAYNPLLTICINDAYGGARDQASLFGITRRGIGDCEGLECLSLAGVVIHFPFQELTQGGGACPSSLRCCWQKGEAHAHRVSHTP